jgi:hypothetical protein
VLRLGHIELRHGIVEILQEGGPFSFGDLEMFSISAPAGLGSLLGPIKMLMGSFSFSEAASAFERYGPKRPTPSPRTLYGAEHRGVEFGGVVAPRSGGWSQRCACRGLSRELGSGFSTNCELEDWGGTPGLPVEKG